MKKTSSSKSLINLARRYSINLEHQIRQQKLLKTDKSVHQKSNKNFNSNLKITTNVNTAKPYDKKDIKQIFQYKIKQKSIKQNTKRPVLDSKKQMLKMINERDNRLKTQAALKKHSINEKSIMQTQNPKQTNITMNLNVSFVKLRSPNKISKQQSSKKLANKQSLNKMPYSSSYSKVTSKQKKSKEKHYQKKQINKQKNNENLQNVFNQYLHKSTIQEQDFQSFFQLNQKIFTEYKKIMDYSLITYQHMKSKAQQTKQKLTKFQAIQKFYQKINILKEKSDHYPPRIIKIKTQPCVQQQLCQSLQNSEVSSYKVNPQKSYQVYRLKKLNESLGIFAGISDNKQKNEVQSFTSPKVYFSKPVSTNISRKISFNNSLNNSLKNQKIQ